MGPFCSSEGHGKKRGMEGGKERKRDGGSALAPLKIMKGWHLLVIVSSSKPFCKMGIKWHV